MNAPAPLGLVRYSQSGGGVRASCLKLHDSRSPAAPSTFAHRRGAAKDFLWCLSRVEFFCVKDFCLARLGHPFPHFFGFSQGFYIHNPLAFPGFWLLQVSSLGNLLTFCFSVPKVLTSLAFLR
uniref:Uncharacterized protein n=1 Tax=Rousettus aegyptiacus TaxID=9407 RepID=A0A7J8FIM2_ROUAE|nr:hypothetical protein HJG63_011985 [Rousettus aegyptiacus]